MPVEVTWRGHSSFFLRWGETALLMDPFGPGLGLDPGRPRATVVTVSHPHPHHAHTEGVEGSPKILPGPGEYEVGGVFIRGLRTPLQPAAGEGGRNTVFVVELEGLTFCHLGDLGGALSARQVEAIGPVDVLMAPAGGRCTLSPAEVREVVRQLEPRLLLPMHYALPGLRVDLDPVEPFLKRLGAEEVERQPRLLLSRSSLPGAGTRVVLLEPRP